MFYHKKKSYIEYSAIDIARYIIIHCYNRKDTAPISYFQLIAMLCIMQSYWVENLHRKLFTDQIYAYKTMPIIKEVTDEYKRFYGSSIPDVAALSWLKVEDPNNIWSVERHYYQNPIRKSDQKCIKWCANQMITKPGTWLIQQVIDSTSYQLALHRYEGCPVNF